MTNSSKTIADAELHLAAMDQDSGGMLPLSFAQESLWFVEQMAPGSPAYNMPEAWRLEGRLEVGALRKSLEELVRRHEILRTVFQANNGKPVQIVGSARQPTLEVVDLSNGPDQRGEIKRLLAQEASHSFDLQRGPMARLRLFCLGPEEHVLALNLHHIISDGLSMGIFLRELATNYGAVLAGQPPPLPDLAIQYADFAIWQQERLRGDFLKGQVGYWIKKLEGPLPTLALPLDHPRPALQSHRGATQFFDLPRELHEDLKQLSRREGATLYMTLFSAFVTLLHRYTREEDIVVGSPVAGRDRPEVEGLIGLFVNTLALRVDLAGDPTFSELLRRVRETTLEAYAHQEVPLEKVIKAVQPERDLSRHPLFQVVFGLQAAYSENWTLPGLTATPIELDSGTSKFDWTLLLNESRQGLRGRFEYDTDLFQIETIHRFAHQFQLLLEGIVAKPQKHISEFSLLETNERDQLLSRWNQTTTSYERDSRIDALFEAQARKTPDAVAVSFEKQELTYAELDRAADQLADRLQQFGAGPDVLVGLCLERSVNLIVAVLAILKAGAIYVPLDFTYPKDRLAFMVQDTKLPLLLTQHKLVASLPQTGAQVLCLEDLISPNVPADHASRITHHVSPITHHVSRTNALAYIIYTSGSTGLPKGVAVSHRAVIRLVRNTNYVTFSPQDVFLQLAPISFDASTFEIWGALLNGAKLVIFPPHMPSLEELGRTIRQANITTLWLTAGLFHQMVDQQIESLQGVRQLLAGGEALSVPHVTKALRDLPDCQLINGYGPTENTTFTCCHRIPASWPGGQSVPIGRPIANTQVFILDKHFEPTPIGVPGELWIGGDGLADGYFNRPELTSEKFVANPFSDPGGRTRLYRSGDLARWLPDGTIEFLGRIDEQLKIRGYRVEPGEIQAALALHPAVREAVVIARADHSGTKQLVAYFVARNEPGPEGSELRSFLETKLPAYMVPSHFVPLAQLPLTSNGKLDRRKLPPPDLQKEASLESGDTARNSTEAALVEIWAEILGRKSVGIHNNFFHLGGHSLLATQVISRIAKALLVELPVRTIFEAPTIAALALAVTEAKLHHSEPAPVIQRRPRTRAEELLGRIDHLSEDEIEALLNDPDLNSSLS
jgi:aspartate racemase